jgi:hypothetical protein
MGFNCPIFLHPLYAHLDQKYYTLFTLHQDWFFEPDQEHSPVVDWALTNERNHTLKAEVQQVQYF